MSSSSDKQRCHQMELVSLYALRALPANEMAAVEAHIRACLDCSQEMESLRPIIDSLAFWPIDVLRPSESLWGRLANRIAAETGKETVLPARQPWSEPA